MEVKENDKILAIDPGPDVSGWVLFDVKTRKPIQFGIDTTRSIISLFFPVMSERPQVDWLVVEKIGNQGNVIGETTFESVFVSGRFVEAFGDDEHVCRDITRSNVMIQIKGFQRKRLPDKTWIKTTNAHVTAVIVERFGGQDIAVGGTKCPRCKGKGWFGAGRPVCVACDGSGWLFKPGPLFGVKLHIWDALGLCLTFCELH